MQLLFRILQYGGCDMGSLLQILNWVFSGRIVNNPAQAGKELATGDDGSIVDDYRDKVRTFLEHLTEDEQKYLAAALGIGVGSLVIWGSQNPQVISSLLAVPGEIVPDEIKVGLT